MNSSITQFNLSVKGLKDLTGTIHQIDRVTTNLLDLSDLYRSQIVLLVSAMDYFVHEFVLEEMIEIYNARRPPTNSFNSFPISISFIQASRPPDNLIASHIRQKHSWLSFQEPDKIADAVRIISDRKVWEEIAPIFGLSTGDLKAKLKLVVDRRNKIAHESDNDPSFPGAKWPIDEIIVKETIEFIEKLVNEIYLKIK